MKTQVIGVSLVAAGLLVGALTPGVPEAIRGAVGFAVSPPKAASTKGGHGHGAGEQEGEEGKIKLSADQIQSAKVLVGPVEAGVLGLHIVVPGVVQPDPDRLARVAGRVIGTVAELRKRLGDAVTKGEVVAILESREVAEAKSEYFAARTNVELQQTLYERSKSLWEKKISAENQYLRDRNTYTEAQLRVELAVQKLQALGLSDEDIASLQRRASALRTASSTSTTSGPPVPISVSGLQRYSIRAPISGQIVERLVNLGAPMGGEGENKEIYVVADLATVWIELAVPTGDLVSIRQGLDVSIASGDGTPSQGRIVFVSPILNPETRSARVIASINNDGLKWRPGSYVTAKVTTAEVKVDIRLPKTAIQTIGGEQVAFVRTSDGFEKRVVVTGKSDDDFVEIVFGLDEGEQVAMTNSFVLKAELGKAEAEHAH